MKYKSIIGTVIVVLLFSTANATVWYVHPDSVMNCVQDCLDSCSTGDTVLVGPGVYSENIVWPSTQGIDLMSEYGVDMTYLDGGGTGRVISFNAALDTTTRISGFTIQNGYAIAGGGIHCGLQVSPTITGNTISQNEAYFSGGGGISTDSASPVITHNIITNNSAPLASGGGIACAFNSNPTIDSNTITYNTCAASGGGIYIWVDCAPTITGNDINNNMAYSGGGMGFRATHATATGNSVTNNTADRGGGIWFSVDDSSTIIGNTITSNTAPDSGGGISARSGSAPHIEYCTIANNFGHGVYCFDSANPVINYNNITDNIGYGMLNVSSITINAESNWWGDATGPYHPTTNPGGLGDTISDYVDYNPWLTSPGIAEYTTSSPLAVELQVSPNPFTHQTQIRCTIQDPGYTEQEFRNANFEMRKPTLKIYDISGRLVKLFNHESCIMNRESVLWWDGTDQANRKLPAGTYFCRIVAGEHSLIQKVILIE
jgi:parallel beta-helix repeat protein